MSDSLSFVISTLLFFWESRSRPNGPGSVWGLCDLNSRPLSLWSSSWPTRLSELVQLDIMISEDADLGGHVKVSSETQVTLLRAISMLVTKVVRCWWLKTLNMTEWCESGTVYCWNCRFDFWISMILGLIFSDLNQPSWLEPVAPFSWIFFMNLSSWL